MRIGKGKGNYVDASTMIRQIGILAPTITSDGEGGYTTTFALQETVWGDFRPQSQNRSLEQSEVTFIGFAKLFLRFGLNITDTYKLDVEGNIYTIHSIKNMDDAARFLELEIYH